MILWPPLYVRTKSTHRSCVQVTPPLEKTHNNQPLLLSFVSIPSLRIVFTDVLLRFCPFPGNSRRSPLLQRSLSRPERRLRSDTDLLDKFIAQYETSSSNKLVITASKLSRGYKVFGCAEHENFPFRFGPSERIVQGSDGVRDYRNPPQLLCGDIQTDRNPCVRTSRQTTIL